MNTHGSGVSGPLAALVLAAGKGTRMKSALPKVLHPVGGRAMLGHILDALRAVKCERIVVVRGAGQDPVARFVEAEGGVCALQDPPLGTGHAALSARELLADWAGDVIVLYADNPLLTPATLELLSGARARADVVLMGFRPPDPAAYGRLILNAEGGLDDIVEAKDCTPEQLKIGFVNAGGFVLSAPLLFSLLAEVTNDNAQEEYYLTDIIKLARRRGLRCTAIEAPFDDVRGVNSRGELAEVEAVFQARQRRKFMAAGVTLADPHTVYFSHDTEIAQDVTVGQNVVFGPKVKVASNVTIRPFCHFENCTIAEGAIIGPYARLRPGAEIGRDVHIGNFVEVKAARIEDGAKANHLAYIGDARVGAGANIGAGTITCNYDGFDKHFTDIGAHVFIGSNSALVAPVKIDDGAYVGAGSVVTKAVSANALAVERSKQVEIEGWAEQFRTRKKAEKAAKAAKKGG
ncbi:MAG TPA: bifunctional UDP-N-acetylglucosamine diphosphorylase/glucosamine-1-phosphate N-acetyltransferase GlmU [Alphaproteobacteria bacterium]|nr:bifunctional UDP-N-acetylglucosamine diphosphorylase/glucosamine-1-phosphate N-acetyltransferase GlmU [Alphaproteobacteria bacterium]HAJ47896.1 bifunctional UDP-N-acetylglucosamine diphosphorylase/glucosamine-1-phosphate N-acetyltransferase GlmU [Alphaproteobacteria bacterium]